MVASRSPKLSSTATDSAQHARAQASLPTAARRRPGPRIGGGIRLIRSDHAAGSGKGRSTPEDNGTVHMQESTPLYRRILYPGPKDRPPRILQTPGTEHVDEQLYTLLALVCRGFIAPWFSKISRDRAFFLEIVRVSNHVFRQLELRLVDDLESERPAALEHDIETVDKIRLIFDTLPKILERHVQDFRTAKARSRSAYSAGIQGHGGLSNLEVHFHSIQPHAAIHLSSPSDVPQDERLPPAVDADYIRAAVDALLEQLLPKEDFDADTERSVVREVIVGIILDGVFRKVAQPWFIYGLIAKQLEGSSDSLESKLETEEFQASFADTAPSKLEESSRSLWSKLSAFAIRLPILFSQLVALFGYLSWLLTTSFASSYYKHYSRSPTHLSDITSSWTALALTALRCEGRGRRTLLQLGGTARNLASISSPILDRILVHYLYSRIFTAAFTSKLLLIVQESLFPNGYPAPSVPDPTLQMQVELKERAVRAMANAMPNEVVRLLVQESEFQDARMSLAEDILEPFSCHYINLHLYLFILDTVVANICPDLPLEAFAALTMLAQSLAPSPKPLRPV